MVEPLISSPLISESDSGMTQAWRMVARSHGGPDVIAREALNHSALDGGGRWCDWLAENRIAAIDDVDTRALVHHVREVGSLRGGIFPDSLSIEQALTKIKNEPQMLGRNLISGPSSGDAVTTMAEDAPGSLGDVVDGAPTDPVSHQKVRARLGQCPVKP